MNFKSVIQGKLKVDRHKTSDMSAAKTGKKKNKQKSEFSFRLYGLLTFLLLGTIGGINWLIDPLWYSHGNILTGKNFTFNERITKSNLFLRTKDTKNYDCLILGSSRTIALRASNFEGNTCFNYAIKGGQIEDFVEYAQFLKQENFQPQKVYIGVDGLNFVVKERREREPFDIKKIATQSPLNAYLSADVFLFSLMTLLGISPDPGNYYDSNFEPVDFENRPVYKAEFYKPLGKQQCDPSIVREFINLRQIFPNAEFIGYVPPRSAWSMINDTYGRGLMDCYLESFHKIAQSYDAMYDFSVPSKITKNPDHTFDGSHYTVTVNDEIAAIIQGKSDSFGIKVDEYSYEDYHRLYFGKLREFLAENNQLKRWQE